MRRALAAGAASLACLAAAAPARAETGVALPASADAPIEVIAPDATTSIRVRVLDAAAARAIAAASETVYPRAVGGADLVRRALDDGVEDLVRYPVRPAREEITYSVELHGVAGLRLVSGTVEFLDDRGAPRLRMDQPSIRDAKGVDHDATVEIEGCAHSTDPGNPWEHAVVPPGSSSCLVHVQWSIQSYPAELDPVWTLTNAMKLGRSDFGMMALTKEIIALGGIIDVAGTTTDRVELFHPKPPPDSGKNPGYWSKLGGGLNESRAQFEVVGLSQAHGAHERVLVAGGCHTLAPTNPIESRCTEAALTAESYDATAGKSTSFPGQLSPHEWSVTKIVDDLVEGSIVQRVLVLGGTSDVADVFDPVANAWTTPEPVPWNDRGLFEFTATTFDDPNTPGVMALLVCGGKNGKGDPLRTCHVRRSGVWSTLPMNKARYGHTGSHMPRTRTVVIAGGDGLGTVERFIPAANDTEDRFVFMPSMSTPRRYHAAARRNGGVLIVAGGEVAGPNSITATAEGIGDDLAADSWFPRDHMHVPRAHHAMVRISASDDPGVDNLPLLVAGGVLSKPLSSSELIAPLADGAPCDHDAECEGRHCKTPRPNDVHGTCCSCDVCNVCTADGGCTPAEAGAYDQGCPLSNATHACAAKHRCNDDGGCRVHDCKFRACVDGECAPHDCQSISDCAPGADCFAADSGTDARVCACRSNEACEPDEVCGVDGQCHPPSQGVSGQISCELSEPAAGVAASMLIFAVGLAGRRRLQKGKLAKSSGDQRKNGP